MNDVEQQRRAEVREIGRLAFAELGDAATGIARVHSAVSGHVFTGLRLGLGGAGRWGLGGFVEPARVLHDAIAGGTYSVVAAACDTASQVTAESAEGWGRPPSHTPAGAAAIAAVNGLIGDQLALERSPLAEPMAVRVDGAAVPPMRGALARAFPAATGRLAVFLHGLMETENAWEVGEQPSYGERLYADLDATAIHVRYNTGRHVSQNGREFDRMMGHLVANWPVPVTEIAIVGHSMGGLVGRSGCHRATLERSEWVRRVRHIVTLGTPHLGAPMARSVHYLAAALAVTPESRPFARLLRRRGAGVRDLFHGSLVDEDWSGRDADALRVAAVQEVPLLPGATHCFVSATVTRSPRNPVGRIVGDGLVLTPSAEGRNRRRHLGFREEDGFTIGAAHHFTLLNHDEVYRWLLSRLRIPPGGAEPSPTGGWTPGPVRPPSSNLGRC